MNTTMPNTKQLIAICGLILSSITYAQENEVQTILDFSNQSDEVLLGRVMVESDIAKELKKEIKAGVITKEDLKPTKIGLITTYLFEEKYTSRKSHIVYVYEGEGESAYFFNKIAKPAINGLKQAFDNSDIELLLPQQFLDSDEKKESYGDLAKKLDGIQDPFIGIVKDMKMNPSGEGFEFIYSMAMQGRSMKVANNLADFAEQMGLDAVLSLEISTVYQSKAVTFSGLRLILHGVKKTGRSGGKGLLLNTYTLMPDMYYPLAFIKGGEPEFEAYEGMDRIAERAGEDYIKYVDEFLEEAFQ